MRAVTHANRATAWRRMKTPKQHNLRAASQTPLLQTNFYESGIKNQHQRQPQTHRQHDYYICSVRPHNTRHTSARGKKRGRDTYSPAAQGARTTSMIPCVLWRWCTPLSEHAYACAAPAAADMSRRVLVMSGQKKGCLLHKRGRTPFRASHHTWPHVVTCQARQTSERPSPGCGRGAAAMWPAWPCVV